MKRTVTLMRKFIRQSIRKSLIFLALLQFAGATLRAGNPHAAQTKNIVLVHGAFVDGSGWKPAYDILVKAGYHVSVVQEPLTSFAADMAAVKRVIDLQGRSCILVAHSYGGSIITEVGNDPKVVGLVYIAAHAPDKGESEAGNGQKYPSAYKSLIKGADGFDYLDPARFPADFAGGLPKEVADFEANAQMPAADAVFHAVIQTPAWRTKPSWYMVAKSDRIINPDLERMYAKRANSQKVEIDGASHSVYESHPRDVARLIIAAATNSKVKVSGTRDAGRGGREGGTQDAGGGRREAGRGGRGRMSSLKSVNAFLCLGICVSLIRDLPAENLYKSLDYFKENTFLSMKH